MFASRINKLNIASGVKSLLKKYSFSVTCISNVPNYQIYNVKNFAYFARNKNISDVSLRTILRYTSTITQSSIHLSELEEFNAVSKIIHNDLVDYNKKGITDVVSWCSKVFDYNLKHGKKNRGTAVLRAYKTLSDHTTSEGLKSACILGWCVELLQAYFLISDDIMDQSTTRRGEPCWYKKPEVGLIAINDAIMLQCGIYKILHKHFNNYAFYLNIVHEFLQITEKTVCGQCLDMLCNPPYGKPNYEKFTTEKYQAIVEHKTSHYTYCLPVHLAMHFVGNKSNEEFQISRELCLKLGLLFQIQDDYLDCYGDPKITGKLGTDIMQGKCTWFAVTFLENADDSLRKEWMETYGSPDKESESKVISLYEKLNMQDKFKIYEQKLYAEIESVITKDLTDNSMQELFFYLLNKTFKRQK